MRSNSIRFIFVAVFLACAVFIAWLAWGLLNPAVQSALPAGDWHNFLGIVCTILIAYFGGIGLPLMFVAMAAWSWFAGK